jgi:hypothetical protein
VIPRIEAGGHFLRRPPGGGIAERRNGRGARAGPYVSQIKRRRHFCRRGGRQGGTLLGMNRASLPLGPPAFLRGASLTVSLGVHRWRAGGGTRRRRHAGCRRGELYRQRAAPSLPRGPSPRCWPIQKRDHRPRHSSRSIRRLVTTCGIAKATFGHVSDRTTGADPAWRVCGGIMPYNILLLVVAGCGGRDGRYGRGQPDIHGRGKSRWCWRNLVSQPRSQSNP